jgi:hypothetical protein
MGRLPPRLIPSLPHEISRSAFSLLARLPKFEYQGVGGASVAGWQVGPLLKMRWVWEVDLFIFTAARAAPSDPDQTKMRWGLGGRLKGEPSRASPCSLSLSATSQQYFSLRTNQPPATSQQYFSLRTIRTISLEQTSHQQPASSNFLSRQADDSC